MESPGTYPTKSKTPVADVARYQNDGTEKITPSKFIERAAEEANQWSDEIGDAMDMFIDGAGESVFRDAADEIARDISAVCDRVRTGRLKRSFKGRVVSNGRN